MTKYSFTGSLFTRHFPDFCYFAMFAFFVLHSSLFFDASSFFLGHSSFFFGASLIIFL